MNYLFNATYSKEDFFFYKFHTVKLYEWCDAVLNSVPLTFFLGGGVVMEFTHGRELPWLQNYIWIQFFWHWLK